MINKISVVVRLFTLMFLPLNGTTSDKCCLEKLNMLCGS